MQQARGKLHSYTAYGVTIQSQILLPALIPAETPPMPPDVMIRFDALEPSDRVFDEYGFAFAKDSDGVYLVWREVGVFFVRDGREILIDPAPGVHESELCLFVQGTVLAILLYQRGFFLLHGSAVAMEGGAAAFVGDGGAGKSTAAAALYRRGHRFMADDIVAIDFGGSGTPMVIPGYPQAKLWAESLRALKNDIDPNARLRPHVDKFAWKTREAFQSKPLPLKCVYILGIGEGLHVEDYGGRVALLLLIRFLYITRFGSGFDAPPRARLHLRQAAQIVRHAHVRALIREEDLDALDSVAHRVEEDLALSSAKV